MTKSNLFTELGKILKPTDRLNDVEDILKEAELICCEECGCYFPQAINKPYGGYNFCSETCRDLAKDDMSGDSKFDADRDERLINGDFPFDLNPNEY